MLAPIIMYIQSIFEQLKGTCKDKLHSVTIRRKAIMNGIISMDQHVQVKEYSATELNRQTKNNDQYVVPILLALGLLTIIISLLMSD